MVSFSILENRDTARVRPWELRPNTYAVIRARATTDLPGGPLPPGSSGAVIGDAAVESDFLEFTDLPSAPGQFSRIGLTLSPNGAEMIRQIVLSELPPPTPVEEEISLGGILDNDVVLGQIIPGGTTTSPFPNFDFSSLSGDAYDNGFNVVPVLGGQPVVIPADGTYKVSLRLSVGNVIVNNLVPAPPGEFSMIRINLLRTRGIAPTEILMSEVSYGGQFFEFAIEASADMDQGDVLGFQIVTGTDVESIEVLGRDQPSGAGRTSVYLTRE